MKHSIIHFKGFKREKDWMIEKLCSGTNGSRAITAWSSKSITDIVEETLKAHTQTHKHPYPEELEVFGAPTLSPNILWGCSSWDYRFYWNQIQQNKLTTSKNTGDLLSFPYWSHFFITEKTASSEIVHLNAAARLPPGSDTISAENSFPPINIVKQLVPHFHQQRAVWSISEHAAILATRTSLIGIGFVMSLKCAALRSNWNLRLLSASSSCDDGPRWARLSALSSPRLGSGIKTVLGR